jgi:hypothetical protein
LPGSRTEGLHSNFKVGFRAIQSRRSVTYKWTYVRERLWTDNWLWRQQFVLSNRATETSLTGIRNRSSDLSKISSRSQSISMPSLAQIGLPLSSYKRTHIHIYL